MKAMRISGLKANLLLLFIIPILIGSLGGLYIPSAHANDAATIAGVATGDIASVAGKAIADIATVGGGAVAGEEEPPAGVALISGTNVGVCGGGSTTKYTTSAVDTTGATLLVVGLSGYGVYHGGTPSVVVSDSKSNSWVYLTTYGAPGGDQTYITLAYAYVSLTVGASHTFSIETVGQNNYLTMTVMAFSGTLTSSDPIGANTGAATASPGTVAAGTAGDVIISSAASDDSSWSSGNATVTGGLASNPATVQTHCGGMDQAMSYLITVNTDNVSPTWALPSDTHFSSAIAVFKKE